MKNLAKYLLILLLVAGSITIGAETQTPKYDLKNCGTAEDLNRVVEKYQEELVFKGITEKEIGGRRVSAVLIVTMSKAGSWTVFEYFNENTVCLMESGYKGSQDFPGTVQI